MVVEKIDLTTTSESLNSGWTKVNEAFDCIPIGNDEGALHYCRTINLTIEDGAVASTIKVTGVSVYNGDAIAAEDSIAKSGTGTYVSLDANGNVVTIDSTGLSGNCSYVLSAQVYRNAGGNFPYCDPAANSNDIQLTFRNNDDSNYDLTTHVDTGAIYVRVSYITDA